MRVQLQRLKRDTDTSRNLAAPSGSVTAAQEDAMPKTGPTPSSSSSKFGAAVLESGSAVKMAEASVGQKRKTWKPWIVGVVAVAAALAGGFYYRFHQSKPLTDKDTVVLADFANSTGDATFDDTLKQALSVQLGQSPFLNILSDEKVNETLHLMGRSPGDRLTKDVTREICQRTASTAMLLGSIAQVGDRYELVVKAENCATGDALASAESEAADKNHVLEALGKIESPMREKMG